MRGVGRLHAAVFIVFLFPLGCHATTYVDQVVQMMEKLADGSKENMQKEKLAYAKFEGFCKSSVAETERSRENAAFEVERLQAEIQKRQMEMKVISENAGELQASIESWAERRQKAKQLREEDAADARESLKQLENSQRVIKRALGAMKTEAQSTKKQGVRELLERMRVKTQEQSLQAEQGESDAARKHEMLVAGLLMNEEQAKKSLTEKKLAQDDLLKAVSMLKGDLRIAEATATEDEAKIQQIRSECMEKAAEYEKKQALREEEQKALDVAKRILLSDEVRGAHKRGSALLQLSSTGHRSLGQLLRHSVAGRSRLVEFLQQRAVEMKSQSLALVAQRAEAAPADAIEKIMELVQDMVQKLQSDLTGMVEKKARCDKELSINNRTRHAKSALVEELETTVEGNKAEIHSIRYEVKALEESLETAQRELEEATKIRKEEKVQNEVTVKEAQNAQLAIARAKEVLENVYAKVSLLQDGADLSGEMDAAKASTHGAGGGILSMLEVLVIDFTKLEADANEAEETAAEKYRDFQTESLKDVNVKKLEIQHKEVRKDQLSGEILRAAKDLEVTKKELQAAVDFYEELKPMCVNTTPGYEERQAGREKEISALRQALSLLE